MVDGVLLCYAENALELRVADYGAVRLERIQIRNVPLDEQLQQVHIDKLRCVGHDAGKELLVLLVAAELCLAVLGAGDDNLFEVKGIGQYVHLGIKAQLPVVVLHFLGNTNLELDVHLTVPFGDVAEAGLYDGRSNDICHNHLPVFILHGIHDNELPPVIVLYDQRVRTGYFIHLAIWQHRLIHKANFGLEFFPLHRVNLGRNGAAVAASGNNHQRWNQQQV